MFKPIFLNEMTLLVAVKIYDTVLKANKTLNVNQPEKWMKQIIRKSSNRDGRGGLGFDVDGACELVPDELGVRLH